MTSSAVATHGPASGPDTPDGELSHKQILEVMTGLLAALFTALISTTIVSTALPTIMGELHGTQRQYTWVITASLLAMTISTPIMGKLSDLLSKKFLIQFSIVIFVAGSVFAGLSDEIWHLMVGRALQGIGMGGLTSLTQAIMGTVIAPRQRGRYSGYMGAVMAVATVSGPLLGGVITDYLNWRWCFFVCVPLAVIALILLQATLKLPQLEERKVKIDIFGAFFLAVAAATPMLWVTFAGEDYAWISLESLAFLAVFVVAGGIAVAIELRHSEPIVPIRVLGNRTTALMIITGMAVGVAMFGCGTFLTQYFQLAGGHTPTIAGLMTIPMILAQLGSSVVGGILVSRTGRWKPFMVAGTILLMIGLAGLSRIDHESPYGYVAVAMAVTGVGVGFLIQNIVLAVQNTVDVRDIGASSATIAFFRSLGGAVGVSILGAVLASHVKDNVTDAVSKLGGAAAQAGGSMAGSDLDIKDLPEPFRTIVHNAYGDAFGVIFLIAGIISIAAFLAVLLVREVPLRTTVAIQDEASDADAVDPYTDSDRGDELVAAGATTAAVAATGSQAVPLAEPIEGSPRDHDSHSGSHNSSHDGSSSRAVNGNGAAAADDEGFSYDSSEFDDPAKRMSVAALDVLTAAQQQVRAREENNRRQLDELVARLDAVSHRVDAAMGGFHRELSEIREQVLREEPEVTAAPDGLGGDRLRRYEYNLLLDSQQTADRVTRLARADAERTLVEAQQQQAALEKRIEELRAVERELSAKVSGVLQPEQTDQAEDGDSAPNRPVPGRSDRLRNQSGGNGVSGNGSARFAADD